MRHSRRGIDTRGTILTTTLCLICRKTKRDYFGFLSLFLTTLHLAVYCWVSLCGLKSMGSVLRVQVSRWVFERGFLACQLVFFAIQSQFYGCSGYFSTFLRAKKST